MKKFLSILAIIALAACSGTNKDEYYEEIIETPTVDYIESLDVRKAPHRDSFLNQLAMNYRSFAIYNARTVGDPQMGELFAQKAVSAFSGETPFPESLDNWPIADYALRNELSDACHSLLNALKNDASDNCPEVAAEAQAKFDCWLSSTSVERMDTANECRTRFHRAMAALKSGDCGMRAATVAAAPKVVAGPRVRSAAPVPVFYPETGTMRSAATANRGREGVVIVNNVNIPQHLINPVPVQQQPPMVFNQNIITNQQDNSAAAGRAEPEVLVVPAFQPEAAPAPAPAPTVIREEIPVLSDQYVTRDEFINMMMAMREELRAINARFDNMPQPSAPDRAIIKVQQVPLEPRQHIMEEMFEVRFDFDKYVIKPEYETIIRQLVDATQSNKNVRISVVGHTDTMGSDAYNFALGGRRAEVVRQRLIQYGIPSSQIVAVSAGKTDLKVPTGPNVKNAENRRATVIKETRTLEDIEPNPVRVTVKQGGTVQETRMVPVGRPMPVPVDARNVTVGARTVTVGARTVTADGDGRMYDSYEEVDAYTREPIPLK
ncbi:MAG: OmpA family protein [Alphaproteobacteria bacterium]|nr:OmpA family protein [Alphaproteobacteria bacterium]